MSSQEKKQPNDPDRFVYRPGDLVVVSEGEPKPKKKRKPGGPKKTKK